jgi:hypothetical protein
MDYCIFCNLHVCIIYVSFVHVDILPLGYQFLLGDLSTDKTLSHASAVGAA